MKVCTSCNKELPLSSFGKQCYNTASGRKYCLRSICKSCMLERIQKWRLGKGKEKLAKRRVIERKKYRAKYPHKHNQWAAEYRARKKQATPWWINSEYRFLMDEAFELAKLREKQTGIQWHVDHIVPLNGKFVSGLHVPWNLQVIPANINQMKSNKFIGAIQ